MSTAKVAQVCNRLLSVIGMLGRCNDIITFGEFETAREHVLYFGGDVQDFTENMGSHRDNKRFTKWNLEATAILLQSKFPESCVIVVKPSKMHLKTFSVYQNFVSSNDFGCPSHSPDYGAWRHLNKLYLKTLELSGCGLEPKPLTIIGFSKGCIVLNQLVYELQTMANLDRDAKGQGKAHLDRDAKGQANAHLDCDAKGQAKAHLDRDAKGQGKAHLDRDAKGQAKAHLDCDANGLPTKAHLDCNSKELPAKAHLDCDGNELPAKAHLDSDGNELPAKAHSDSDGNELPAKAHLDCDGNELPAKAHLDSDGNELPVNAHLDCDSSKLINKVKTFYWLDGGHSGGKSTWVTNSAALMALAQLTCEIRVHVTPYQVKDELRTWIGKEERQFVRTLKKYGANISETLHFENETRNIDNHFKVLEVFR